MANERRIPGSPGTQPPTGNAPGAVADPTPGAPVTPGAEGDGGDADELVYLHARRGSSREGRFQGLLQRIRKRPGNAVAEHRFAPGSEDRWRIERHTPVRRREGTGQRAIEGHLRDLYFAADELGGVGGKRQEISDETGATGSSTLREGRRLGIGPRGFTPPRQFCLCLRRYFGKARDGGPQLQDGHGIQLKPTSERGIEQHQTATRGVRLHAMPNDLAGNLQLFVREIRNVERGLVVHARTRRGKLHVERDAWRSAPAAGVRLFLLGVSGFARGHWRNEWCAHVVTP